MKDSKTVLATTFALAFSLPVLADSGNSKEAAADSTVTPAPMTGPARMGTERGMMNPQMMQQRMGNNQGVNPATMMNPQWMQNRGQMNPGTMMGGQGGAMNGQMMQNRQGMYSAPMMNSGAMMGNQRMPMMNNQMMNPGLMHEMMGSKQSHMVRMEGLLTSIDASLKQLVAQGK